MSEVTKIELGSVVGQSAAVEGRRLRMAFGFRNLVDVVGLGPPG